MYTATVVSRERDVEEETAARVIKQSPRTEVEAEVEIEVEVEEVEV